MNYFRIVVAYDGTCYHGWQEQDNATTISGILIEAFRVIFHQEIKILGASRTDAGVHALGQVAIVQSPIKVDPEIMLRAWSKAIPSDIVILSISSLDRLVHPHDGVLQKTYIYNIFLERPLPTVQRFGWFVYKPLSLDRLKLALRVFIGTHDFRSFCTGNDLTDTIRTIDSVDVKFIPEWNAYRIEMKGKSFLRYMVRRLVGASVRFACDFDLEIKDIENILIAKNPNHTLPNAPAKGLILERIQYAIEGEVV